MPSPRKLNPHVPESIEAVILRALARQPDDRYATADAMQEALEEAMRKESLRGSATDLAKFMNETFAAEEAEQRRLISQAQRGELGAGEEAAQLSPMAAAAAAEAASNYVVDNERTSVDLLPPLAEESGRNWKSLEAEAAAAHDPEFDSQENIKTRAQIQPLLPTPDSQGATAPSGVPALRGQIPTIYYVFAVAAVILIVLIAWLIAR